MKKLGVIVKETQELSIREHAKDAEGILVVRYSGLSGPDMTALRQVLRDTRSTLCVVKNSVARRALKDAGVEGFLKTLEGPCGIVFVRDEPVDASKALYTFIKDHEPLKVAGGVLKDRLLAAGEIEALSRFPSKDVLRAQAVGALKAPITGLVFVLKGNLRKLLVCLDQIRKKRS